MNVHQEKVCDTNHNRQLILKVRQLGMSTYAILDILDDALFNRNYSCGIVSYSLEHAQYIFKKIIGHALHTFPDKLKPLLGLQTQSAREVSFANGSSLRVDTSLRGGSYQSILISEFGKTCARSPLKAEEVVTGTMQAVDPNAKVIIESTGEGNEGYFADMCHSGAIRGNENLSPMEFYFHFFPWYEEKSYSVSQKPTFDISTIDYLKALEENLNITFTQGQYNWYALKQKELGDKIKQEYPSTVEEAFFASSEAYYYAHEIETAYATNRCLSSPLYDPIEPVYVAMDLGVNDMTSMVFFQSVHGEMRIIDYYEDNNKGTDFYAKFLLQDKPYLYHTIYLPHDAKKRDGIVVENTYERDLKRLFQHTGTKVQVLKSSDKNLGISQAKLRFSSCVFALNKTRTLLNHLTKYRKKWSEATGRYLNEPLHDVHSHAADAFRYACQAYQHVDAFSSYSGALDRHKEMVDNCKRLI